MIFWSSWIKKFLKTFKTKTVKHKDFLFWMQVKETPPMHNLFVTSVSVYYNKLILSARFGDHIMETDKVIYKVRKKNTNEFFLTPLFADLGKKCTVVLFEIPSSILTTKYL